MRKSRYLNRAAVWTVLLLLSTTVFSQEIVDIQGERFRVRWDYPLERLSEPGTQTHGVSVLQSRTGYTVRSVSKLNGSSTMSPADNVLIAFGQAQNWSWEVRAASPLLPS